MSLLDMVRPWEEVVAEEREQLKTFESPYRKGVRAYRRWDLGAPAGFYHLEVHPYRNYWDFDEVSGSAFSVMFDQVWEELCFQPLGMPADPFPDSLCCRANDTKTEWELSAHRIYQVSPWAINYRPRSGVQLRTAAYIDQTQLRKAVPTELRFAWLADGIARWLGDQGRYEDAADNVYRVLAKAPLYKEGFPATTDLDAELARDSVRDFLRKSGSARAWEKLRSVTVQNPDFEKYYRGAHQAIFGSVPYYFRIKEGTHSIT
jgi:hypothetical protein